ncbi:MAG: hypothetical protein WDN69_04945 [Aliidongia sp.]
MPTAAAIASPAVLVVCAVLGGLALLIWAYELRLLANLTGSDAAGNGMTQGFAALALLLLWLHGMIAGDVDGAVGAMAWLVGYGCSCDREISAREAVVRRYPDVGWDAHRLAELHDPQALGRILREAPARFSMLTPAAHLKAWLSFADDTALRDRALAGGRSLDHRTADAVEMLDDEFAAGTLLRYLPELDLEPTPALCAAASRVLRGDIERVYRPAPDDPRSYAEFMDRLRGETILPALALLARHGCDVDAELGAVASLALAYQDDPARAPMLSGLAELRHRP